MEVFDFKPPIFIYLPLQYELHYTVYINYYSWVHMCKVNNYQSHFVIRQDNMAAKFNIFPLCVTRVFHVQFRTAVLQSTKFLPLNPRRLPESERMKA